MQICAVAIVFAALIQTINGALQGLGKVFVPAAALTIGVLVKLILNLILVPIPTEVCPIGGAAGAAFATNVCHIIAFIIVFTVLSKTVDLKLSFSKTLIKPLIASIMMAIVSYGAYILLKGIFIQNVATIIALFVAIVIYVLSIIVLKIFSKEDILMLPYGQKIYAILEKIGIYKEKIK